MLCGVPLKPAGYFISRISRPAWVPARTATELAEAAGFDVSLIWENLALSYEQRVIQHQAALDLVLEMERAGQILEQKK
jgi:hypothetical protein